MFDRGPRAPLIKNPPGGALYCKTQWPGGMGGAVNGVPPDPKTHVRVSAAVGLNDPRCYPRNLAAIPDLVSNGTYGGGFKFGADGSALSERSRQAIASAERARDAGYISQDRAALQIGLTVANDGQDPRVGLRARAPDPNAWIRRAGLDQTGRGAKKPLTDAELAGICHQEGPSIWCRTRWPYGLVDLKGMTDEEVLRKEPKYLKWTGKEGETCPPGVGWWMRAGAWIVRETYGALNETGEGVKALTRQATRKLQYTIGAGAFGTANILGDLVGVGPAPAMQWWCRTIWPGGWVEKPVGEVPQPPAMWAKVDNYGDRPSPPCFPGV